MRTQDLPQAIRDLSEQERLELMLEVGPDLCRTLLQQPALRQQMMKRCQERPEAAELLAAMHKVMAEMAAAGAGPEGSAAPQTASAASAAPKSLDPVAREWVALAAAVAGHCGPCFAHHHQQALALGATPELIGEVIALARQIRAAGDRHHDDFIARRMAAGMVPPNGRGPFA